jgi:hypothetical protein
MNPEELERVARKRANAKMGWLIHALVFVVVNAGLALVSGLNGRNWAVFPAFGWGLGLLIHGAVVYGRGVGVGLRQRLLERERAQLAGAKDPW